MASSPRAPIGGDSTAALLRKAREDDDIKAVVLRIDSPGGSVLASEQIYREVQALRSAGKPVVASMGEVAASGGYYIAAPADEILASAQHHHRLDRRIRRGARPSIARSTSSAYTSMASAPPLCPARCAWTDRCNRKSRAYSQAGVDHSYAEFLQRVAKGRGQTTAAIDEIAQGRVWAGSDALRLRLVDRLGHLRGCRARGRATRQVGQGL